MNLLQLLFAGEKILKENREIESPRLDCEVLLSHLLDKDRVYLMTHREEQASEEIERSFLEFVNRRKKNEPVSYITGVKEFMSLPFRVTPGVLIPRPDTEILAEVVIEKYKGQAPVILDVCTGSGAIAVSLANYIPRSMVYALDISETCVQITKENAEANKVADRVYAIRQDALAELELNQTFDCIVSNPPYIQSGIIDTLDATVKEFEPRAALDGGEDGLLFYRHIIKKAPQMLNPGGMLAFEVGYDQADAVRNLLLQSGRFNDIGVRCDLAGVQRVLYAAVR